MYILVMLEKFKYKAVADRDLPLRGGGGMNGEFCEEDNSGSVQEMRYFRKKLGGGESPGSATDFKALKQKP